MVKLTHLNNKQFFLNPDLIQYIETTPDSLIVLLNGDKVMVKESAEEIVHRFHEYKRKIFSQSVIQIQTPFKPELPDEKSNGE